MLNSRCSTGDWIFWVPTIANRSLNFILRSTPFDILHMPSEHILHLWTEAWARNSLTVPVFSVVTHMRKNNFSPGQKSPSPRDQKLLLGIFVKAAVIGKVLEAWWQENILVCLLIKAWGFPGGCSKDSARQWRRHGCDSWSGRISHAEEQLSPCTTTTDPVSLEPVLHNGRSHRNEKPMPCNWRAAPAWCN